MTIAKLIRMALSTLDNRPTVIFAGPIFETHQEELMDYVLDLSVQSLTLRAQQISRVLPNIRLLIQMTELDLAGNFLEELPESFGLLTRLKKLRLSHNSISRLPNSFGNLESLCFLYLEQNCLSDLPESFGSLPNLTQVNLSTNNLTTIPKALRNCNQMECINLGSNYLKFDREKFPSEWRALEILSLEGCRLKELSQSIDQLTNLKALVLKDNDLRALPDMKDLVDLNYLQLSNNPLVEIPTTLLTLKKLETLVLMSCRLNRLPDWLGKLRNLKRLYVNSEFPPGPPMSMDSLDALFQHDMHTNTITEIPRSVAMLPCLKEVSFDPIQWFPPAFFYRSVNIIVPAHRHYCQEPSCVWCPQPVNNSISPKEVPSLMALAARRIGLQGKDVLGPSDVPKPCLELIQSSQECTTPGCSGVFVKGVGLESLEFRVSKLNGYHVPFLFKTCHPMCCAITKMNQNGMGSSQ